MNFKCNMCGGTVETQGELTYGDCDSCGTTSTFPEVKTEKDANRFNRANELRQSKQFDRAVKAYEDLVTDFSGDAEAYWGLLLSRYGIEYVEDPRSHEWKPTCNRVLEEPILKDPDYLAALENAEDSRTRDLYITEAEKIAVIQREILEIIRKEKPYDVFICYKETEEGTDTRTKDSEDARDIYLMLHNEGFRVFFAKISLKDHAGEKYEPYIFNALNTAKVMLVIGSKPEYFEAVWVRNEWSRYLELIKKDKTRKLIPCIKDMNPYDLPEELKNYQALNMSDMGFSQAIINIVKPYKKQSETQAPVVAAPVGDTHKIPALYKRACMFLEDGDFKKADEYFNTILDIDPEYAPAHMGKYCVSERARGEEHLKNYQLDVDSYIKKHLTARDPMGYINVDWSDFNSTFKTDFNFCKALQYANPEQKARYEEYDESYQQNNKNLLDRILSIREEQIAEADRQREERIRQHNEYRESQYKSALEQYNALPAKYEHLPSLEKILSLFKESESFENADDYITEINSRIEAINQKIEKVARTKKRIKSVFVGIWAVITFILKYFVWYPVKFICKAVWAVIKFIFNLLTGNL